MKVSTDLLFIFGEINEKVIIYNYYTNRAVMVGLEVGNYLKSNIGKTVDLEFSSDKSINKLKKNGILIDNNQEYELMKFEINSIDVNIKIVYFHVTQRCNLNCIYCYNKSNLNKGEELDLDSIKIVLNELIDIGVKTINVTGGEALLREDILEILTEMKYLGFHVCLLTNGTLIGTKLNVFDFVDECIISLDDVEIEENNMTRIGSYEYNILDTIKNLPTDIKRKIKVKSVIIKGKEGIIENNKKFFEDLGVKYEITACLPNNKNEIKSIPELVPYFTNCSRSKMCGAGKNIIAIDSNGDIYPCQTFVKSKYLLGNVLEKDWYNSVKKNISGSELINIRIEQKVNCKDCEYKFLCLGGCPNLAFRVYNDIYHANDFLCELYKANARKFLKKIFEGKY